MKRGRKAMGLIRDFLQRVEAPAGLAVLLSASADRLEAYLEHDERWQALALPVEAAEACGGAPADRLEPVIGCSLLLFLAADLLDDAADGDLRELPWSTAGWARVTNAGVLHVFLGLHAAQSAPPDLASRLAAEIAEAGYRMCCGQHLDLCHSGPEAPDLDEYLAAIAGKTGGSFRMQCRMGALAADAPAEVVDALGDYGLALGGAMQLAGDVRELLWRPGASDLRNGRWTLPTIALRRAGWAGHPADLADVARETVRELLIRHGALAVCEAEFARLMAQADAALARASRACIPSPPGLAPQWEPLAARTRIPLVPPSADDPAI